MSFKFIDNSQSRKIGDMPSSYSPRSTCPDTCGLKNNGCYGDKFPIRLHWDRYSSDNKNNWEDFVSQVRDFRQANPNKLWRYNVVGDLVGNKNSIDFYKLKKLVKANNKGKVLAYTHKHNLSGTKMSEDNIAHIRYANKRGFTINLSADNVSDAKILSDKTNLPVATVLSVTKKMYEKLSDKEKKDFGDNLSADKIVICPEQTQDKLSASKTITCDTCQLCANPKRKVIVGFLRH